MSYQRKVNHEVPNTNNADCYGPQLKSVNSLIGSHVYSQDNGNIGEIKEIMLDINAGKVCYAILYCGGYLCTGEKLFAVPWQALMLDLKNKRYVLNIDAIKLDYAPSFDKDDWPNMADETWANTVHSYYGTHLKRTNSLHSCM